MLVSSPIYTAPEPPTLAEVVVRVLDLINGFLFLIAPIALVGMLIYGGITRMKAAENPQEVKKANMTITMAIVGFGIVMSSMIIVRIVAGALGYTDDLFDYSTIFQ